MSAADIAEVLGKLTACWCIGFAAGYLLTRFKDAVSQAV